jgi:hypothetical protein
MRCVSRGVFLENELKIHGIEFSSMRTRTNRLPNDVTRGESTSAKPIAGEVNSV